MIEEWRPVAGHERDYEVSSLGRVRSVDRIKIYERVDQYSGRLITVRRRHRSRILRPGRKPSGHFSVALGRGNSRDVHVLVLEAFVGPAPDGHECRHLNDNPAENHLRNLCWGTRSENNLDAIKNGKRIYRRKLA